MELYNLKPNDNDFIIKKNVMYCCKNLVNIPVLSIIKDDFYLHTDMGIINSVKQVLKLLNKYNVKYFLYTPNLRFNADVSLEDTSEAIVEFITNSILGRDNIFFTNFIEKDDIKINDIITSYLLKYNHLDILHEHLRYIIETYEDSVKNPYKIKYRHRKRFLFDGVEIRMDFIKKMNRNLIIEDILNF